MNKKNIWLVIPTMFMPYLVVVILSIMMFGENNPFGKINPLGIILLYSLIATILNIFWFVRSIIKKGDPILTAKWAMIIKVVQIPAYIAIFILGICLMITIFTIPFVIGLFFIDSLILFLTGLITISSAINSIRLKKLKITDIIWVIILQFVFCADVVVTIIYYLKIKKEKRGDLI